MHRQKQYADAIRRYQKSISVLQREVPVRTDVILDQQLNIVTILLDTNDTDEAEKILDGAAASLKHYEGTLLEVRYLRRRRRLLEKTKRWAATPAVQRRIIAVLSQHVGSATQSVTGERRKLVECYQDAGDWESGLSEAIKLEELVQKMPKKFRRRFGVTEALDDKFPTALRLHSAEWGERKVVKLLKSYAQFVENDSRKMADAIEACASALQSNVIYEMQLAAISGLGDRITREDRRQAVTAHFCLMYAAAKGAATLEAALKHAVACIGLVDALDPGKNRDQLEAQAHAMNSVILCKLGRLQEAERMIDRLQDPGPTLTELEELGPIFTARDELAKAHRRRGDLHKSAEQYELLARMLERRRGKLSAEGIARIEALKRQAYGILRGTTSK